MKASIETCGAYWELQRSNCGSKNMPFNGCTLHRWTCHNLWSVWRTTQYQTHKSVMIKLHQIPKLVVFSETKSTWPYKIGTLFFLEWGSFYLSCLTVLSWISSFKAQTSYRKQRWHGCVPSEKRQLDDDTPKISFLNTIQVPFYCYSISFLRWKFVGLYISS